MKKIYKTITTCIVLLSLASIRLGAQPVYCNQQATSTADDEIFNVTLGTLNNTSSCGQVGGPGSQAFMYQNYTGLAAPNLTVGMTQTFAVTVGQCSGFAYSGTAYAWIDYNQNGTLNDPGELVFQTAAFVPFAVAGSVYTNTFVVPFAALNGPTRMRVTAVEGTVGGPCGNYTWGETEDYNVNIVGIPCTGAPAGNTVVSTPTGVICPGGTLNVSFANTYTNSGLLYTWLVSTVSAVGPFVPAGINPSVTSFVSPTVGVNTWYQAIVTCTPSGNQSITAVTSSVQVQGVTTNSVPYFEGFEGVSYNGQLPNCSWSRSTGSLSCQTYTIANTLNRIPRTGSKFAAFNFNPGGTNSFYTNGIFLNAGVTYSAGLWYTTESTGFTNFTNLAITVGNAQNQAAQTITVAQNSPALSVIYKPMGGVFTVPTSGLYYVGVRASYNASGANFLSWDDLEVTIPCQLNTPAVSVTGPTVACAGAPIALSASGANNYSWNTGATTPNISAVSNANGMVPYTVVGTNTLSGCSATVVQNVLVNPSPVVSIFASNPSLCAGSSANLTAFGANTYQWSNSASGNFITVSPQTTTSYTVIGTNQFGCTGSNVQQITVNPLPNVAIATAPSSSVICVGESITLTGSGASTYQWTSPSLFSLVNPVSVTPPASAVYTLTGTDANGCAGKAFFSLNVSACTGLSKVNASNGLNVYPNPNNGEFTIEMNSGVKTIEVSDVTGRVISSTTTSEELMNVNISTLSSGIYYVKIKSAGNVEVVKVVKQ